MSAQHTPGPWHADAIGQIFVSGIGPQPRICFVDGPAGKRDWEVTVTAEEKTANERLIAAAPEMKAAIIEADGCFEAALTEGWMEALADGDIIRIRDLWERRLSHTRSLFPSALAKITGAA